jgi:hypothetical protein
MVGRKKCPADDAALLPLNPQVRTRPGAPANLRLCATFRRLWLEDESVVRFTGSKLR